MHIFNCILYYSALRQDGFGEHPLYSCLVAEGIHSEIFKINILQHREIFFSDSSSSPVRLVGMCLMFNIYSTWEGKCLHLEDLYVQSDFRKQGIGKAFFSATYQVSGNSNAAFEFSCE